MKDFKVKFYNPHQHALSGKLEMPVDEVPCAYAIFAHCFTCTKNLTAIRSISKALTQQGIAVLRFDFTGLGESEGDFEETGFTSNVQDLIAAAEFLQQHYQAPALLIGHSFGGPAVLAAAASLPSVKAVATINAPFDPAHLKQMMGREVETIEKAGEAQVNIGGRPFVIREQFIRDIEQADLVHAISRLDKALMILHSPQDRVVDVSEAARIYKAAKHPKSFIALDGADHLLSDKEDARYAGNLIGCWVKKYVEGQEKEPLESERRVAVRTGAEGYVSEIKAGHHYLVADEPVSAGGTDIGPTPYDLLVASLGTCTGMTLRMYADRKGWPLQNIIVHMEHGKIHSEDCKGEEGKTNKIDHIVRELELEGDLTDEQRKRLLEIADKCPVHKTLHSEISITTKLMEVKN